jgi:hypothetical protein
MSVWRRFVLPATTVLVAVLASAVPPLPALASAPPSTDPAATAPGPTDLPAPGQEVQSWALIPANDVPDRGGNRPNLTYVADPGAVITDAVTLMNLGTDVLTFRVFATDAFNNADGQFDLLVSDQKPVDVGSWVSFPQEMITVPAGKQVTVPMTITIPPGASAGDHVGAVLASSPTLAVADNGPVITVDRRTGTRIYLRVNGPLFPELAVTDVETTYHQAVNPLGGSARVTYRVENRGNVRLGGTAKLTIGGPLGLGEQQVVLPDIPELLPGQHVDLSTDIDDVPAGFRNSTTVSVQAVGSPDLGDVKAASSGDVTFAPPLFLLGVLLAVLFGLLALRAYRRRVGAASTPVDKPGTQEPAALEPEHQTA